MYTQTCTYNLLILCNVYIYVKKYVWTHIEKVKDAATYRVTRMIDARSVLNNSVISATDSAPARCKYLSPSLCLFSRHKTCSVNYFMHIIRTRNEQSSPRYRHLLYNFKSSSPSIESGENWISYGSRIIGRKLVKRGTYNLWANGP